MYIYIHVYTYLYIYIHIYAHLIVNIISIDSIDWIQVGVPQAVQREFVACGNLGWGISGRKCAEKTENNWQYIVDLSM